MNTDTEKQISIVINHFKEWRTHRKKGRSPIPEELWKEAVILAKTIGLNQTCKTLGLNHTALKHRLNHVYVPNMIPQCDFIELPRTPAEYHHTDVTIELGKPEQRILIHIKAVDERNLASLTGELLKVQ